MKHEKGTLIDNLILIMDALLNGESEGGQCKILLMLDDIAVFGAENANIALHSSGNDSDSAEARGKSCNLNFEISVSGQLKSKRLSSAQLQLLKQWYKIYGRQLLKSHFERVRLN